MAMGSSSGEGGDGHAATPGRLRRPPGAACPSGRHLAVSGRTGAHAAGWHRQVRPTPVEADSAAMTSRDYVTGRERDDGDVTEDERLAAGSGGAGRGACGPAIRSDRGRSVACCLWY